VINGHVDENGRRQGKSKLTIVEPVNVKEEAKGRTKAPCENFLKAFGSKVGIISV